MTTDTVGELSLAVLTTDLSCPSLSLWGNFMDQQEAIVIYPDHETSGTLSDVQGGDLSKATTYDGSSMLPSGYSTADDLASAIRQTMGSVPVSLLRQGLPHRHKKLKDSPTKYISFPDSTPNMLYQPQAGSTGRPYTPGSAQNWLLTLGSDGSAKYTTSSRLQKPPAGQGGISDIKTFAKNCVHGAENVGKIAWTVVNDVVTAVVTTAENLYNLTVSAVEHAFTVVAGILKTVIGDLKKAWQWLSYVFNWHDILQTKDQIKTVINDWFSGMEVWSGDYLQTVQRTVDGALNEAQTKVTGYVKSAVTALGGTTTEGSEVHRNDPLAAVGEVAVKWYSAMKWLNSKFTDNLSRHSTSKNIPPSYSSFSTTIDNLFADVQNRIKQNPALGDISKQIDNFLHDLFSLMSDPATAVKRAIADLVSLVGDFAILFLQLIEVAADEVLSTIPKLFAAVQDLLNQEISIFGISALWKAISKDPLTTLDLISLMIALPATIIMKAKNASVSVSAGGNTVLGDSWIWYAAAMIHTIVTALQDFLGNQPDPALAWVQVGLSAALCAFTAPNSGQEFAEPHEYTGWMISVVVFLLQATAAIKRARAPEGQAGLNPYIVPTATCVCGVVSELMALMNFSNDIKTNLVRMLPAFPMMAKPMKLGQSATPATGVLAGIDTAFGYTQIGIKTSLWA